MDSRELPDLSDWLTVEVWSLEEAAMLWAAIDPFDHQGTRIADLGKEILFTKRRKALVYQRAAIEAVCAGTLPFVVAKEREENEGYEWIKKIDPQDLPDRDRLIPHETAVKSAAFMQWAKNKKIKSYRQIISGHENQSITQTPIPALPIPNFRNPSHPRASKEIIVAADVWEEISGDAYIDGISPNPKQLAKTAINNHPIGKELSEAAKDRISTAVNWKPQGGCNKTPGE